MEHLFPKTRTLIRVWKELFQSWEVLEAFQSFILAVHSTFFAGLGWGEISHLACLFQKFDPLDHKISQQVSKCHIKSVLYIELLFILNGTKILEREKEW